MARSPARLGLALLIGLTLSPLALAQQVIVTLTDGRTFEGELIAQNEEEVVLEITGIRTPLARDLVQSVELQESIEQQYQERRAEIEDDDLDERYQLAYWLYDQGALDLAQQEIDDLLERFPQSDKVQLLQRVVQQRQQMLAEEDQQRQQPAQPRQRTPRRTVRQRQHLQPDQRLSQEQINRIKVYEVDLTTEPRVRIPRETIDKLLETHIQDSRVPKGREAQAAFHRLPEFRQLQLIFDLRARELYDEVVILDDPPALQAFRTQVHHNYVLNYCATSQCHGGAPQAMQALPLFQEPAGAEETIYTNFYILNQHRNEQGLMIDRDQPPLSLLLQYGLPRNAAATPHPDVSGWRPAFTGPGDPRFERYARILNALYKPAPSYGIDYQPPQTGGSDQPQQDDRQGQPAPQDQEPAPETTQPPSGP